MSVSFATICKFQRSNLSLTMDSKMISERGARVIYKVLYGGAPRRSLGLLPFRIPFFTEKVPILIIITIIIIMIIIHLYSVNTMKYSKALYVKKTKSFT